MDVGRTRDPDVAWEADADCGAQRKVDVGRTRDPSAARDADVESRARWKADVEGKGYVNGAADAEVAMGADRMEGMSLRDSDGAVSSVGCVRAGLITGLWSPRNSLKMRVSIRHRNNSYQPTHTSHWNLDELLMVLWYQDYKCS